MYPLGLERWEGAEVNSSPELLTPYRPPLRAIGLTAWATITKRLVGSQWHPDGRATTVGASFNRPTPLA